MLNESNAFLLKRLVAFAFVSFYSDIRRYADKKTRNIITLWEYEQVLAGKGNRCNENYNCLQTVSRIMGSSAS